MISVSPYLLTDVIIHDREEKVENENEAEAMRRVLEEIVQKFIDAGAKFGPEITRQMEQAEDIVKLTNQLVPTCRCVGRIDRHWQRRWIS